ncbi:MAG: hypothetical protein KDK51_06685 [Deltaproteobacteria bacterium]|nr:hypothetical protein [Deltaproteobacteria bacterium]
MIHILLGVFLFSASVGINAHAQSSTSLKLPDKCIELKNWVEKKDIRVSFGLNIENVETELLPLEKHCSLSLIAMQTIWKWNPELFKKLQDLPDHTTYLKLHFEPFDDSDKKVLIHLSRYYVIGNENDGIIVNAVIHSLWGIPQTNVVDTTTFLMHALFIARLEDMAIDPTDYDSMADIKDHKYFHQYFDPYAALSQKCTSCSELFYQGLFHDARKGSPTSALDHTALYEMAKLMSFLLISSDEAQKEIVREKVRNALNHSNPVWSEICLINSVKIICFLHIRAWIFKAL